MKSKPSIRKNYIETTIIVLLTIAFFCLYTYMRSSFLGISFLLSFYQILTRAIYEIWEAISNPTVLITLILLVSIWVLRKYLRLIFSSLTEIKAGNLTAKVDPSRLITLFEEFKTEDKPNNEKGISEENLQFAVNNLTLDFCKFLIKHEGELFEIKEFSQIIYNEVDFLKDSLEKNLPVSMIGLTNENRWLYYFSGFVSGLGNIPDGIIDFKTEGNEKMGFEMLPNAKTLISKRVNQNI